ncbi:D-alanyl-D-alanine carboxypeptidase/D-alanyl-D-alanine-endopeptidase [Paraburkholderia sp. 22099]|jgi:D-alanyl-D-alanine carboxypeptidase/D-alanyl-D-alanine-endopeptidase (penicillin-binding protein 4)|uniref:D-alanyl-D-alanine carboxypeptidase/D-alanyl-D-alanine-endopeptidase n=1 Tax=Paraburkholderia sp. 22099 TaxID=3453875 RepID=UPI003F86FA34
MNASIDRQRKRCAVIASAFLLASCGDSLDSNTSVPDPITQVMQKSAYKDATWSMQAVDLDSGRVIYDLNSSSQMFIASVRKVFSTGNALNALGAQHQFVTPVYRQGTVAADGTLNGNLILVASGDLTMGGRANADGTIALTSFDHNEANALGNAVLSAPDPLAGYNSLAAQVAAAGIKTINGDVVIDDRLFQPFNFRDEFEVRPIFVNDDVVDVSFNQSAEGAVLPFDYRPKSAAFTVQSTLKTGGAASALDIELAPELPPCIGSANCVGTVSGTVPADFVPPLTDAYPLIRTFRVTQPSNYARTIFIEALTRAGVTVTAAPVAANPAQLLPAQASYASAQQVARLVSAPFVQDVRYVNKVSYNIGADVSLMLFGLAKNGSTTMAASLAAEQSELSSTFGISPSQYHFIDGSGGGDTTANGIAVVAMLRGMRSKPDFAAYVDSMPALGVDGSLTTITNFEADATLAGAKGRVHAKTGTYVGVNASAPTTPILKGQSLAGYIDAKSGRRIVFFLTVNNVPITGIPDILTVFQDQGTIAALLWKLQ